MYYYPPQSALQALACKGFTQISRFQMDTTETNAHESLPAEGPAVYLLGAGASHGYQGSLTGVNPPLATNFFSTFNRLLIATDFEVKIGNIVNYIRDTRGIGPEEIVEAFDGNIEDVFAEVHERLLEQLKATNDEGFSDLYSLSKTYDQFIFWFAHVLNEIQNGAPDPVYAALIAQSLNGDVFITFNWDTLLDRALSETGTWFPDDGYGIQFHELYDRAWCAPGNARSEREILKLHGSTNWLAPYLTLNFMTGERNFVQDPERARFRYCVVDSGTRYESYKDRWRPGYQPYSYFFPPNDPVSNVPLMPILIPPTSRKDFSDFPEIFHPLWDRARARLKSARRLVIIGYSFPRTDSHAFALLDAFLSIDTESKVIEIIDPYPGGVRDRVEQHVAGRCQVTVHEETLAEFVGFPRVDNAHSEFDDLVAPATVERLESDPRLGLIVDMLITLNLDRRRFDLTTYGGLRLLDCSVPGEFATHIHSAHREENLAYRLANIPIATGDDEITFVSLDDIWVLQPLPDEPLTEDDLHSVDLAAADENHPLTGETLRQMVRESYHCVSDEETEAFLRRVLAANRKTGED